MLKISPSQRSRPAEIPRGLTTLSVSWLNGQFKALAVYRGLTVSLLLAHPRLVHQLVEVPPVKGAAMQKVIHRQAQQQKMFDGEAAWAYQTSLTGKGSQRVVLHLFPKLLLD